MSRAINKINRATNKLYKKYNLTGAQFAVLEVLYNKGDLCVGEVQEKILSTSGTIPVIVKNLEKEGLLTRRQDEDDKRRFVLQITNKGINLMDKVYPENKDIIISIMDIWSEDEKNQLLELMKKFGGIKNG